MSKLSILYNLVLGGRFSIQLSMLALDPGFNSTSAITFSRPCDFIEESLKSSHALASGVFDIPSPIDS